MFETIGVPRRNATRGKQAATTAISVLIHAVILTVAIALPMWYLTPETPTPPDILAFVAAAPAPPPPPPAPARSARREPVKPVPPTSPAAAPVEAPSRIEPEKPVESVSATTGVLGGVEGGVPGGVVGGIVGGLVSTLPPPPPPPPPPAPKPAPVRIGGQIKAPALVRRVAPEYPAIAQAAQLQGIVILEATVDEAGQVRAVKVLRSAGPLDGAAVDAVKQWQYSPLTLNGRPTPFVLTVTVQFHLAAPSAST